MANINDVFNKKEFSEEDINEFQLQVVSPKKIEEERKIKRQAEVRQQLEDLFKTKQRTTSPTAEELQELTGKYFSTIFPENFSKYTYHTFLGFTEENVSTFILTDDNLKEIYDFAIEKLKAKYEIQMNIAGRSTDAFSMQNVAGWRKKDPEDKEESSGLAEFHKALRANNNSSE